MFGISVKWKDPLKIFGYFGIFIPKYYNMRNQIKQLHVRLKPEIHKKLKIRCVHEDISMQECLDKLVAESLARYSLDERSKDRRRAIKSRPIELLQHFQIFRSVVRDELKIIADATVVRHFNKGEIIIREEEVPAEFYLIQKGRVKIVKASLSGKELILDVRSVGETFAESATLVGIPCYASTKAMEDATILAIRTKDFAAFIARNPHIAMKIIWILGERIRNLYDKIIDLAADTASHRLIRTLCVLSSKYGNNLPYNHQEIGEMSGITMETATRVLIQLKDAGILSLNRGRVTILDQNELQAARVQQLP